VDESIDKRPKRILVVDDERIVWDVISNALDKPGMYLVYAADGEEAIRLLLQEPFDLLIADKNLPGITGLDVIRRAKATDSSMATLLITAYASRESAEEAMAIGVDDYIVKPFDIQELQEMVTEVLDRRQELKRLPEVEKDGSQLVKRVMICEDRESSRQHLVNGVSSLGHKPLVASSISEVLEAVRKKEIDVLICDLAHMQRDDAEACFLRSTLLVRPDICFIAVAAERGLENAVGAIHHGARRVVYRPMLVREDKTKDMLLSMIGDSREG